jgi:ankyrin repeat protein
LLFKQKGITANPKNKHGETPLHYASRKGNQEIIKILTENGADTSVIREFGKRMILKNLYNRYFE